MSHLSWNGSGNTAFDRMPSFSRPIRMMFRISFPTCSIFMLTLPLPLNAPGAHQRYCVVPWKGGVCVCGRPSRLVGSGSCQKCIQVVTLNVGAFFGFFLNAPVSADIFSVSLYAWDAERLAIAPNPLGASSRTSMTWKLVFPAVLL